MRVRPRVLEATPMIVIHGAAGFHVSRDTWRLARKKVLAASTFGAGLACLLLAGIIWLELQGYADNWLTGWMTLLAGFDLVYAMSGWIHAEERTAALVVHCVLAAREPKE